MQHKPRILAVVLALPLLLLSTVPPVGAQPGTIEEIVPRGLFRMTDAAFLHALGVDVGDPYDVELLRDRFRSLWDRKLFEDITFEAEEGPKGGKVLIIKVRERPQITAVSYEENRVASQTQIEDALKEAKISLKPGTPLDMGVIFFAESAIRDLLAQRGFLDAQVTAEVRTVTETSRAVDFRINPGGKTRISRINFTGNEVFKDKKLKGSLQLTQERKWYWPYSKKNLYHPLKWDQDIGSVRTMYQNRGYLDVEFRAPVVEVREDKKKKKKDDPARVQPPVESIAVLEEPEEPEAVADEPELTPEQQAKKDQKEAKAAQKARKKEQKESKGKRWVYLTVPVNEGAQYTLGEITFSGNEVYPSEALRTLIPLRQGDILSAGAVEQGITKISRLYEDRGYLYSSAVRRIMRREGEDVADVEILIEEDAPYYIGRIEFRGNTATRDAVLRREMLINEGALFNRTLLDISKAKINQLGYFQTPTDPVIQPIEGEQQVSVTYYGEEAGRNEIQIGGGYSGLEGAFFNGVYSTRNFLGRGQVVSVALQVGGRSSRYQLSFQDPWFLGKPYLFGASVFRRDLDYGNNLATTSTGFGLVLGKVLRRFTRVNISYNFENVVSDQLLGDATIAQIENTISSITPVLTFNSVNNPYRASRGSSLTFSVQVAGGPLGGDTSFIKPLVDFITYRKGIGKKNYMAFHTRGGFIRSIGSDNAVANTDIQGVPRFSRFWLGGDTIGPRAFETRTITPRRYLVTSDSGQILDVVGDPTGLPADSLAGINGIPVPIEVGGDRMYLFQAEFVYPMNQQAEIAWFFDGGDVLFEDTRLNLDTMRLSTGVELRFHLPIFPVPLRLIYGVPIRKVEVDRTNSFTFSIGRSF